MEPTFEWDPDKAESNLRKHGISFEEAATAFLDALSLTIFDPFHSRDEDRFVLLGNTESGRLVVVAYTERGDVIPVISARSATPKERKEYEEG